MKKIFLTALLLPAMALAQTYPSPTFSSLILQNPLTGANGGTGVANSSTITLGGNLVTSGANPLTFTTTGSTNITLPTSGTLLSTGNSTGSGAAVLATSPVIGTPTISGGTINNASLGATTPSTGAFTALSASGVTTVPTPVQFDNSTKAATTAFVKAAGYLFQGQGSGFSTATTLTLSQLGNYGQFLANVIATLPAVSSTAAGSTYTFIGGSTGGTVKGNGADQIVSPLNSSANTFVIVAGETATVTSNGTNWSVSADGVGASVPISQVVTQPSTGQFYVSNGATVNHMNDRIYLGAATVNPGNASDCSDYVSENIQGCASVSESQLAVLSTNGFIGLLAGTKTSLSGADVAEDGLGMVGVVINDASGADQQIGEAAYFEGQQKTGAGFTTTVEADSVNQSGSVTTANPYTVTSGATDSVDMILGAGGARSGVSNSTAAIDIVGNGAEFNNGIIFGAGSLGTVGAISFPQNDALQWYSSAANLSSFLESTAASNGDYGINLADAGTFIGQSNFEGSTASLQVVNAPSAVDYVAITGSITGSDPTIGVTGSDSNITLAIDGRGTDGVVIEGNQTGSAAPSGAYGQFLSNSTTGTSMTTGSPSNLTSESLTPGVWDIECTVEFVPAASTTLNGIEAGVSTASATFGGLGSSVLSQGAFIAGTPETVVTPVVRENLSTTTTGYCVGQSSFGTSTMTGSAYIRATRVN